MQLYGFVASTRSGSVNRSLFEHVRAKLENKGHDVATLDYAVLENIPLYTATREQRDGIPEPVLELAARIKAAHGLMIGSPEYNFSMPGPLKNALDWLSRIKPYATIGKPVLLMSASGSPLGGWRGLAALRIPLACLGAQALAWDITLGSVATNADVERLLSTPVIQERIALAIGQFG